MSKRLWYIHTCCSVEAKGCVVLSTYDEETRWNGAELLFVCHYGMTDAIHQLLWPINTAATAMETVHRYGNVMKTYRET
jgi:hypothetical protein